MLRLGAELDEVAVVDDQRTAPTYVGHLAPAVRELLDRPRGLWRLAADGHCSAASGQDAPELPHWREGLRACLERLA
jgi:dTDP-4-dehydrorhamnose reductase